MLRSHGEDALCSGSFPGYGKRQDAARRWWLCHHRRRTFPHAAGGRFGPCCHSGSRRVYAWDYVAERRCVGVGLPWWAGRGRETVAWGGRGRRYTARVGELVVLVEAAMARESESPPSAAAAVGGDASGGDGGRPKKAKARRPTDLLTQAVETVLDGVAPEYIHRVGRRAAYKHLRRVVQDLTWHGGVVLPSTAALVAGTGRRGLLVLERSQRAPKGAAFSDGRFRRARCRPPCIRDASATGTQVLSVRLEPGGVPHIWCHKDAQRRGRDVDSTMAKEIMSFARDAEPSTTTT